MCNPCGPELMTPGFIRPTDEEVAYVNGLGSGSNSPDRPGTGSSFLTRRGLLKGGVAGVVGGVVTAATGLCVEARARNSGAVSPERSDDTLKINLAVAALKPPGQPGWHPLADLWQEIDEQCRRVEAAGTGAVEFTGTQWMITEIPPDLVKYKKSKKSKKGELQEFYSMQRVTEVIRRLHQAYPEIDMVVAALDGADVDDAPWLGIAPRLEEDGFPYVVVRSRLTGANAYAHEIGHHLKSKGLGGGMGHELYFSCKRTNPSGECIQAFAFDTIQELIRQGRGDLERNPDGTVNEYASPLTVMGDARHFSDRGNPGFRTLRQPIYSAVGVSLIDPRRRIEQLKRPVGKRYDISYWPDGERFGVELELPANHVLKNILPQAKKLFFGPVVDSLYDKTGAEKDCPIEQIGVFATWNDGKAAAYLGIGMYNWLNTKPGDMDREHFAYGRENVIYADEQLDIVALTGFDGATAYIRFVACHEPEGQRLVAEQRQRVAERDALVLSKKS